MILGRVNHFQEAIVEIGILGSDGKVVPFEAILDTGFTGALCLPSAQIGQLGLPLVRRARSLLADGSKVVHDVYQGIVFWDGKPNLVSIDSGESTPLVGMALMRGYELRIQVEPGGDVSLTLL